MLLAIDIGNTHTVLGFFEGKQLMAHWRLSTSPSRTDDETWGYLQMLVQAAKLSLASVQGVVVASVVPSGTDAMVQMSERYLHRTPVIVSNAIRLGIAIRYHDPSAVGADRICNAVAAFEMFGGPSIVVDFGTATTYDVIAKNGDYLGGAIAPGIATASSELHRRAARLPRIDLHFPDESIGRDTAASMRSGIMFGAVDAMEGMIRRISKELGSRPTVIATGGFSSLVASRTSKVDHIVPTLVLDGARIIFERVTKTHSRVPRKRR